MSLVRSLRNFKSRVLIKKSIALFFINKKWPQKFGRLLDFSVDQAKSVISLKVDIEGQTQELAIKQYQVKMSDNKTFISWGQVSVSGGQSLSLKRLLKSNSAIELPAVYYTLVSRLLIV